MSPEGESGDTVRYRWLIPELWRTGLSFLSRASRYRRGRGNCRLRLRESRVVPAHERTVSAVWVAKPWAAIPHA